MHFQGFIQLRTRRGLRFVRTLLPRAHWEVRRGTVEDAVKYCKKQESSEGHFFECGVVNTQGQRNDLKRVVQELYENDRTDRELYEDFPEVCAKYPRFIEKVRRIGREDRIKTEGYVARPGWQAELEQKLLGEPHPREVLWYTDKVGNSGKSLFANRFRGVGGRGYRITGGDHASIKYAYGHEKVVFFDWPRSEEERFPYKLLEQFKDGYFLSTKYDSHGCDFEIPHVVVFANFDPDQTQLSRDRWVIKNI